MAGKPTYNELERKSMQLEKEVLEYIRKAKELNKKQKVDRTQSFKTHNKPDAYK